MNKLTFDEFKKEYKEVLEKSSEILIKKNEDYSNNWANFFKNFDLTETITDWKITAESWFFTRIWDKISRIWNLLFKENSVVDEKIDDTLLDLINYSILFYIYIKTKKLKYQASRKNNVNTNEEIETISDNFMSKYNSEYRVD